MSDVGIAREFTSTTVFDPHSQSFMEQVEVYTKYARYATVIYPLDYDQTHRGNFILDYRFSKGDGGKILAGMGINLLLTFSSGHPYIQIVETPQSCPCLYRLMVYHHGLKIRVSPV